ncbi:hypothetical protein [Oricola sp.]|uniref:hypothetical protein n=1 Tax=Oricola sp. TaxID=1979950 RepID=UPI0025F3FF80|nr:hypothetical protein [Oricola sp.]MCI5076796.1 hypothetical protein [Oricola sp.]
MDICTFWHGERLRDIDYICVHSMVAAGFRVAVYSFEPVENLPAGAETRDAREILSADVFRRIDPDDPDGIDQLARQQFSDIFRIALMKHARGFWLDTDVLVLRPFEVPQDKAYLARESATRLGVSAMYFPPDHPVIGEFDRFLASDRTLPDWLGWRRRVVKPAWLRLRGKPVKPTTVGVTVFGNDGISRLAHRHGFFDAAAPRDNFYALTGRDTERFYDGDFDFRSLFRPDVFGFHVHHKEPSFLPPQPGSMYEWAARNAGIIP